VEPDSGSWSGEGGVLGKSESSQSIPGQAAGHSPSARTHLGIFEHSGGEPKQTKASHVRPTEPPEYWPGQTASICGIPQILQANRADRDVRLLIEQSSGGDRSVNQGILTL